MTEGMSQGLLIVVSIVIFGIFALMAYLIFEDTLNPALEDLFGFGIEQAEDNTNEAMGIIKEDTDVRSFHMYYQEDGDTKRTINAARESTRLSTGKTLSTTAIGYDSVEDLKAADFNFGRIHLTDKDGIVKVHVMLLSAIEYTPTEDGGAGESDILIDGLYGPGELVIYKNETGDPSIQLNLESTLDATFKLSKGKEAIIQLALIVEDTKGNKNEVQYVFKRLVKR